MPLPSFDFLHLSVSETQDFQIQGHCGKVKGQSMSHHYIAYLHSLTNVPNKYKFLHLKFLRYSPDKIFKLQVTLTRSKVKSRSHHDVAHLHPVSTKFQLPNHMVPEIQPRQPMRTPSPRNDMGENKPATPLKALG